jgi:hypothetical protein
VVVARNLAITLEKVCQNKVKQHTAVKFFAYCANAAVAAR